MDRSVYWGRTKPPHNRSDLVRVGNVELVYSMVIPTRILPNVTLLPRSASAVARSFRALIDDGCTLIAGGKPLKRTSILVRDSCIPKHEIDAEPFGLRIFLTNVHQNPDLRFLVAYVMNRESRRPRIHARIFYKDTALMWRAASHLVKDRGEFWIGKGDVTTIAIDGEEYLCSEESTTDLPFELQTALEQVARSAAATPVNDRILERVLRRAEAEPRNRVNRGRSVAVFARKHDPSSLRFVKGFEPDLSRGIVEVLDLESVYYGGHVQLFRILSTNQKIQYAFMAAPRQVWIIPPQALTTELTTFALRTINVSIDEDVCVPGYEFHYMEETDDGLALHSQIPPGFAGAHHPQDDDRADASPWLEQLPIVHAFRAKVLGAATLR